MGDLSPFQAESLKGLRHLELWFEMGKYDFVSPYLLHDDDRQRQPVAMPRRNNAFAGVKALRTPNLKSASVFIADSVSAEDEKGRLPDGWRVMLEEFYAGTSLQEEEKKQIEGRIWAALTASPPTEDGKAPSEAGASLARLSL
jgi:hypothetical protein